MVLRPSVDFDHPILSWRKRSAGDFSSASDVGSNNGGGGGGGGGAGGSGDAGCGGDGDGADCGCSAPSGRN